MNIDAYKITTWLYFMFWKGIGDYLSNSLHKCPRNQKVVHEISLYYNITHNSYKILNYEQKYFYLHSPFNLNEMFNN